MEAARIEPGVLIGSVAAILCVEGTLRASLPHSLPAVGAARLLETLLFLSIVLFRDHGLGSIGLDRSRIPRGLKRGLLWSAGFGVAALVVLGMLFMAGVGVRTLFYTRLPAGLNNMLLFFLVGGIVAPVAEEVFFRGILYGFFRRWGFIIALFLSTGIFLLAHPMKGGIPFNQLVGGILFAVAYEVEGNLMVPITVHVLGNMAIFALSALI